MNKNWKIDTLAVQAGFERTDGSPQVAPLVQSTTFKYDDAQSLADLFDLKKPGHFYTRLSNPTVEVFETKLTAMEGGVGAVATSAGQTASMLSLLNLAGSGDHILSSSALYGGTGNLFRVTLKKLGIEFSFVDPESSYDEIVAAIKPNTKAIFAETLANPALKVLDIELFARAAHDNGIPLILDNTFPTPILCRPFEFGADIVVHASTKYIDGHATSVGGIIIDSGNFDFAASGRFPEFTTPDPSYHGLIYTKAFGKLAYVTKLRAQLIRDMGTPMAPFNAWLSNFGAETLHLRMERHSSNALKVAKYLQGHPKINWVNYPFLPDNSQYEKAKKYLKSGSGVITCGVAGGAKGGEKLISNLELITLVTHVADARTCVLHPASTTHRQLSEEALNAAGVPADLLRVSIGIEDADDIIADLDQALSKI